MDSAALPLGDWDHSLFGELQHLLARINSQPTTSTLRRLYAQLDEAKPWLLGLTHLPGPSDLDKQVVETRPTVTPSGVSLQLSGKLLATVNSISTYLHISQRLAATLALQAEEQRPRYPSRSTLEISIFTFHEWTAQMLDFLRELLRSTIGPDADVGAPFGTLREWVETLLTTKTSILGKGDGTLVDHIVSQVDAIQEKLATLVRSGTSGGIEYELLSFRVAALRAEQNKLVGILAAIARAGLLGRGHVVKVLRWLKKCDRLDGLTGMILASFISTIRPLDSLDPADGRYDTLENFSRDVKFMRLVASLVLQEQWSIPSLREAAKLAWCLFYLSALRQDNTVLQTGVDAQQTEQFLLDAISGDALRLLRELALIVRRERGLEERDAAREAAEDALVKLATRLDPVNDDFLFAELRQLVGFIAEKKHLLRNLRNKEEDAPRRSQLAPPPAHFQDFLWLASAVYRSLPPDSAEELWENTAFTSAVLDTRGSWPGPAYWDLMVAISTGPICAAKCYERIKDTRLQWSGLFKFYQHYTEIMPHLFEPIKSTRAASLDPMSLDEVEICKGWTKLLATVVQWSPLARIALLQAKTHPLQQLFELVNCDVPVDLKAVILQAITAFCKRTGDAEDVPNKALDYYERISFADPTLDTRNLGSSRIPTPIGWVAKMEYAEQDLQSYPCTRAYIEFLTTLIPSTSAHSTPRLNNALRRGFYYIVDRVLCVDRRYVKENEKWETLEAIFAFVEKALLAFNMSELVSVASRSIGPIATALADEPGFLVLLRLLSEQDIFESLALVIDHAAQMTPRPAHVQRVLLSVLRIYQRVLDIQLVFSDVLLLTLSDPSRGSTFRRPLGLQSLDQYLLGRLSNVNAIALLVGDDDLAAALVSVKIIAFLSSSPVFSRSDVFRGEYSTSINRLAGIIDASDDSIRIAQGFCSRLDGDGQDLTAKEVADAEALVLDGSGPADPLLVRHAILDLLLDGTTSSRPNLAHFLLGFDYKAPEFGLQDPRSPESRLSCFHVVLRQLTEEHLFVIHPTCATKNAQLVHQLFAHPVTGRATMSYASSIADFFPRQLASLPRFIPPATKDAPDLGVAVGREQVITTAAILVAFLEFQRWIVSSAALESFAFEGHGPSAERVAEILFEDEEDEEGSAVRPPLIISLVGNIDIQWQDTPNQETARNLEFFAGFDFDQFKRPDVDWWDLEALERSMQTFRRQLERQGAVQPGTPAVVAEIDYVVRKLGAKNRETNVALAKGDLLTAWSEALKVSLTMLFRHVAEEQQEAVLFGLLDVLLHRFEADLAPGVLEILCESVLVTVTTLVSVLSATDGVNLPVERLATVMRGILDAVTLPGVTETARGNLYASMSQYLQLVTLSHAIDDATEVTSMGGQSTLQAGAKGLRQATVSVLASKDRFLSTLCRDAMDDRDVWKTECFALLGGIVSICHTERERQILSPIGANGFLALYVASIKDREIVLSECLGPDFDNLHAYWVYEAKIAFLMAIASTKKGAEALLDAGLFETFSTCGFMTVQPLSDESMGDDETMQRQHRVLICGLQLLARVLSNLSPARPGAGQAIGFLNAHREALLLLLRENQQYHTMTGVEETRLVIAILAMVVHKVPTEDLRSPSGFGAFHLAVLSVAARFFDLGTFESQQGRSEIDVLELDQIVLSYLLATTTGLKTGSGYPAFVIGGGRGGDGVTKYISSAPSLGLAVDFVQSLAETAQNLMNEYESVVEALESSGGLDGDAARQVESVDLGTEPVDADTVTARFAAHSRLVYSMIESLLLLLWRHLLFYAGDARDDSFRPDKLSASLNSVSTSRASPGTAKVLERVAASLRGTLERIEELDTQPDRLHGVSGGGSGDAYRRMLLRRLKELTAGLTGLEVELGA